MRALRVLLASLLLVGTLPLTSHAADGDDGTAIDLRPLTDAIHSHIQAMPGFASQADWATAAITDTVEDAAQDAVAAANERYRSQLVRATAIEYLNVAKKELRGVKARQAALQQLPVTADSLCLHLEVEKKLKADVTRLQQEIKYYRGIIGDRRGFFTKVWHRIGPTGRRIVRAFVQEALPIVASGGSLAGGVARGIGLRAGRQEIKNAIEAGLARQLERRYRAYLEQARRECESQEATAAANAAATPSPVPGPNTGTGVLVLAGVLRHPQAHVSMEWDDILGQGCTFYQTYNPSLQNLELPGVEVALELDFDAGTFVALIEAPTHGSEPGAAIIGQADGTGGGAAITTQMGATGGWDGWGRAVVVITEGKLTPREGGSGWDLEGTGASGLYYSMVGECVVPGERIRMPPLTKQTQGSVAVSGRIDPVYPSWELDLMVIDSERDAMIKAGTYSSTDAPSQRFRLDLIDVPIQSQK